MTHSTKKPTAAEARRMDRLSRMPCVCCVMEGKKQPNKTDVHHLVDKGYRIHSGGHSATIPLCRWHHAGVPPFNPPRIRSVTAMAIYGPSLALHKRAFVEKYGTERSLLERINRALAA